MQIDFETILGDACLLIESGEKEAGVQMLVAASNEARSKKGCDRVYSRMAVYRMYDQARIFSRDCEVRFGKRPPYAFGLKDDLDALEAEHEVIRNAQESGDPVAFSGAQGSFRRGSASQ